MLEKRRWIVFGFLAAVALASAGVWRYGYLAAMDQLERAGRSDLALASDRLMAQLERYRELAVLLTEHPAIGRAGGSGPLFLSVADKTGAYDVAYADARGRILVSTGGHFGKDVGDDPAFARAMHGALGTDHRGGGRLPRLFVFAAPDFAPSGQVRGALLVAVDIEFIEVDWRGGNPAVYFTDDDGQVFISNRSEILFWKVAPDAQGMVTPEGALQPFGASRHGGHEVWRLGWSRYLPARALHLTQPLPVIGMVGEVLVDVAPARRLALVQAAAVAALCLAFGALLFMVTERRRALAEANVVLEARVAERTSELEAVNTELRRAQADLVEAGKLSALGRMSAGISHELNQPLMAIQSFAENGSAFLARGRAETAAGNLERISDLARRMGRIIRNLRAFARQDPAEVVRTDVTQSLQSALDLAAPRLRQAEVTLEYAPPEGPVWVRGGDVRLGQVFVNLIANAVDAMAESNRRVLTIRVSARDPCMVSVADTGPGIAIPDKVFEPFYSTKEVGASEGMGLGLSISYGIVQSFGGDIRGENTDEGARFTVMLEPWAETEVAA